MDFPKRSSGYFTQFTKQQAIKELQSDSRIDKIVVGRNIVVYTNDIYPKCTGKFKNICITSIGRYKITITNHKSCISISIKHLLHGIKIYNTGWSSSMYKGVLFNHFHISRGFGGGGVCWGTVENDINKIKEKKDYYYAVKYSLDLLEDCKYDEGLGDRDNYLIMIGLQMKYCIANKKQKTYNELKKLIEKHIGFDWTRYMKVEKYGLSA